MSLVCRECGDDKVSVSFSVRDVPRNSELSFTHYFCSSECLESFRKGGRS